MMNQYGRGMAQGMAPGRMQQPNYQLGYGHQNEDDDDEDDYGQNYYDEEDDDDEDDEELRQQYMQNVSPGSLFQGHPAMMGTPGNAPGGMSAIKYQGPGASQPPQRMSQPMGVGGMAGYGGGAGALGMGYGGVGAMGGIGGGANSAIGGGGGITYGMASKAGAGTTFGGPTSTTFGTAPMNYGGFQGSTQQQTSNPGLFSFGGVSSFGGVGGGAGSLFGNSNALGGASGGDQYANINIDLNKIKKVEAPPKSYEQKTEEEKKKDQTKTISFAAAGKSNLKKGEKEQEDQEEKIQRERKRSVTFGKSTTYEVDRDTENSVNNDFNKQDVGGKGSPRPDKKVIDEKDLSNGRNAKEKIREMLEKQEQEQLNEAKKMSSWKPAQESSSTSKTDPQPSKFSSLGQDLKNAVKDDESIGESSSMSRDQYSNRLGQANKKVKKEDQSYSDDYNESSLSGSITKDQKKDANKLVYWPGKDNIGDSSASYGKNSQKEVEIKKTDAPVYDGNIMEEYIKRQQQQKSGGATSADKKQKIESQRSMSESSDKYEGEEFESISKSQMGMSSSLLQSPDTLRSLANKQAQLNQLQSKLQAKTHDVGGAIATFEYNQKSVVSQYIKKENKQTMTDLGKYSFIDPNDATATGGTYKEWTLQQNLKDAELMIQELKAQNAELKQTIQTNEIAHKKREVDLSNAKRDVLNYTETNKSLTEKLSAAVHKINVQKIELEGLIKQIDLADAKTREKEDEIRLSQADFDRKLQLQEERILMRRSKHEDREVYEVKRQFQIERETLQRKLEEKSEELDYFQEKVGKLEQENKNLRVSGMSNKRIKELEDELQILKHELAQASSSIKQKENIIDLKNLKTDMSKEEQIKLQKELQQLENLVQGYERENQKMLLEKKHQDKTIKQLNEKVFNEQKKAKDFQQRTLLEAQQVYVEQKQPELDVQTVNDMGNTGAISQKDLAALHNQLRQLTEEKQNGERNLNIKESQLKAQIQKLREEKEIVEKQLLDTEFIAGGKDKDLTRIKDEYAKMSVEKNQEIKDLEDKIQWFRDNQKLIDNDDKDRSNMVKELGDLRSKMKQADEDKKRLALLEKNNRQLEETIKAKNPNSIPMLIQATKKQQNSEQDDKVNKQLQAKIRELEVELANRDEEFDRKLRALRQDTERMKSLYQTKQGMTADAKRVAELEDELEKQKKYFIKKIATNEDKLQGKVVKPPKVAGQSKGDDDLAEKIKQLEQHNKYLAQKVIDSEVTKRRQSQSGPIVLAEEQPIEKHIYQALISLMYILQAFSQNDQFDSPTIQLAAISCVQQLTSKEATKPQLSKKLKELANGKSNPDLTNEIIQLCKPQLLTSIQQQTQSRKQSQCDQNSNTLNQDLSQVTNKYEQPFNLNPKQKVQSQQENNTIHNNVSNKQYNNPFKTISPTKVRPVQQILKALISSGIDMEKIIDQHKNKHNKITVAQMYNGIKEGMKDITLDEAKLLRDYVKQQSGGHGGAEQIGEDIDCDDLMNVIMDLSIDPAYNDNQRYSQDRFTLQADNQQQQKKISNLQLSLEEQKMEYEHELKQTKDSNKKFQQIISEFKDQIQDYKSKITYLETHKTKLEKILKANIPKTSKKLEDGGDIIEEISLAMKRLELLENQSDNRDRLAMQEHQPCQVQIKQLQDWLEQEKLDKQRLLAKKTSEVAYFKAELDTLMNEMRSTMIKKQGGGRSTLVQT